MHWKSHHFPNDSVVTHNYDYHQTTINYCRYVRNKKSAIRGSIVYLRRNARNAMHLLRCTQLICDSN